MQTAPNVRPKIFESDNPPDVLYHYTNSAGLIGIINEQRLWATHIRHFDDGEELWYAETVYEQMLTEIETKFPADSVPCRLAKASHIEFSSIPRKGGPLSPNSGKQRTWLNKVLDIYVACFSTSTGIQSQWMNYADCGRGFAVGMRSSNLLATPTPCGDCPPTIHLTKVLYDPQTQRNVLRSIFDHFCSDLPAKPSTLDYESCASKIVKILALCASKFKGPQFEVEDEWRIVVETLPLIGLTVHFRNSAGKIIPYVKTAKLSIDSITIGPAADQSSDEHAVRLLFGEIIKSE